MGDLNLSCSRSDNAAGNAVVSQDSAPPSTGGGVEDLCRVGRGQTALQEGEVVFVEAVIGR